jgi:hypothetical protein
LAIFVVDFCFSKMVVDFYLFLICSFRYQILLLSDIVEIIHCYINFCLFKIFHNDSNSKMGEEVTLFFVELTTIFLGDVKVEGIVDYEGDLFIHKL